MRTICRAIGFPGTNLIDAFSSCFLLQALFQFLPVIAHILVSGEYCILCAHDFPFLGYDERLVSDRLVLKLQLLQFV
jgi:hypothetical protein